MPQAQTRSVALADAGRVAVDELLETIETAFDPTIQLLPRPSGAGKTTELYRLPGELTKGGYRVALVEPPHVNNTGPLDVTDFPVGAPIIAAVEVPRLAVVGRHASAVGRAWDRAA